jgi:NAD dependent epimerase/dehydratase family
MSLLPQKGRALVTGGAGLIGSHLVDLLLAQGWSVRVLDNLEPQTHRDGKPLWLQAAIRNGAEFVNGDIRNREVVESSLDGIDVVFHQAAYGGYMPEISKYVAVNSFGTAQLLEIIREKKCGIRKIVVASSQVVYPEGAGECPHHGLVFPGLRPIEQLRRGDFSVRCPTCQSPTKSVPTPEYAPIARGNIRLEPGDADAAAQIRARILEIPVNHRRRRGGASKVSGSFKGTILATCRIAATFFRVAFSSDRRRSTVGRE